jgi:hypothetical protein
MDGPDMRQISTSFVERRNLTIRQAIKGFARRTLGYSKKLANLKAALAPHFAYYNLCRVHQSLKVTPAMEASLCDHILTLRELLSTRLQDNTKTS